MQWFCTLGFNLHKLLKSSNFASVRLTSCHISGIAHIVTVVTMATLLFGCSSTRHVPQGQYLVDKVDITMVDNAEVEEGQLVNYLRQTPNHKVLGFLKLQLATYNMSGRDSTKWYNRWARKLGQPPVIYDQELTDASAYQLHQAMVNRGYLDAEVTVDTIHTGKNRKVQVDYRITTGLPHYISTIDYSIPDSAIASLIAASPSRDRLKPGDLLDRNRLEDMRTGISEMLRNNGYFTFTKDYITFTADTAAGARDVNLTLNLRQPSAQSPDKSHLTYRISRVIFVTDYNPGTDYGSFDFHNQDTVYYRDIEVLYGADRYLRPQILYEASHIAPGQLFSQHAVDLTYEALGRLGILRYVNIDMRRAGFTPDGEPLLDAYILLTRGKKQGVSLELEGTNSEGDLGFGVGVTYQHRNLAHGSELLSAKFRTSYESLSGDFNGLINNRYMEYAGEIGITFPQFEAPFLSYDFKRRIKATT